ncbi:MAG: cytochrome c3 family protein [Candidatus Lernaella stagnicola]|nr:cytochrome c3 family protein [Candidatus Lernaella stagnicola]
MKKYLLLAFALALVITAVWAADVPETVDLSPYVKVTVVSKFDHKQHVETGQLECTKCHHKWGGGEEEAVQKCSACHKEEDGETSSAKTAFHKMCKDCHKEQKEQGKTPPVTCSQCHVKKLDEPA